MWAPISPLIVSLGMHLDVYTTSSVVVIGMVISIIEGASSLFLGSAPCLTPLFARVNHQYGLPWCVSKLGFTFLNPKLVLHLMLS